MSSSVHDSNNYTGAFPQGNTTLQHAAEIYFADIQFTTLNVKRTGRANGQDLTKLIRFADFSRTLWHENCLAFALCVGWSNIQLLTSSLVLIFDLCQEVFALCCFYTISENVNKWNCLIMSKYYHEYRFDLVSSIKGS